MKSMGTASNSRRRIRSSIKPDGGGNQATVRLQVSRPHNSFANEEAPSNGRLGKGLVAEYQGLHKGRIANTCPFRGHELPASVSVFVILHDIKKKKKKGGGLKKKKKREREREGRQLVDGRL
jgi:hypothetical protein